MVQQPVDDDLVRSSSCSKRLREFIGQSKVKENLSVAIEAARSRGEALDHVLLSGPPGLGKTTLATIIANELGVEFRQTSGPVLQIKGDLTAILTNVKDKQVLFFDGPAARAGESSLRARGLPPGHHDRQGRQRPALDIPLRLRGRHHARQVALRPCARGIVLRWSSTPPRTWWSS
jgi:hypothetical protein